MASADSALSSFMTLSGREISEGNLLKTHFMFAWGLVKYCNSKCYESHAWKCYESHTWNLLGKSNFKKQYDFT